MLPLFVGKTKNSEIGRESSFRHTESHIILPYRLHPYRPTHAQYYVSLSSSTGSILYMSGNDGSPLSSIQLGFCCTIFRDITKFGHEDETYISILPETCKYFPEKGM